MRSAVVQGDQSLPVLAKLYIRSVIIHSESMIPLHDYPESEKPVSPGTDQDSRSGLDRGHHRPVQPDGWEYSARTPGQDSTKDEAKKDPFVLSLSSLGRTPTW
jgi:hypothetical protein